MKHFILTFALICVVDATAAAEDYTYSCWLNGWRKGANDRSADIFGIETSRYGFALDLADFRNVRFGQLSHSAGYEQALKHRAENLKAIPPAQLLIEIEVGGTKYRANTCKAGQEKGVKHLANARLWESGRYVQHYDFLGLDFRSSTADRLPCDARLDVVAWPGSLTFNLEVSAARSLEHATMRLGLTSEAGSWSITTTIAVKKKCRDGKNVAK